MVNWAGIIALGLGDVVALDFMERVFSARDGKTASKGCIHGWNFNNFNYCAYEYDGNNCVIHVTRHRRSVHSVSSTCYQPTSVSRGAALLMGVLGASMSTANGGLRDLKCYSEKLDSKRDILRSLFKKAGIEDKKLLILTRCVTIPVMLSGLLLGAAIPRPGIYLILAFDIVFAGLWAPLTLGLFWKKANWPAAIASIVVGSTLRLVLYYTIPAEYAGLDTFIPPIVSFVLFIIVALLTQKKDPGFKRHGVVDYVPPEEDVVNGEDLRMMYPHLVKNNSPFYFLASSKIS